VTQFSRLPADRTRSAIPWTRWASRAGLALLILGIAVIAGFQIAQPDKRVLQVVAAGLILLLAFKTRSISALVLAVLFLPFPKSTSYGNTNVAFMMLVFVVWLFRVTTKRAQPAGHTAVDLPILGLVLAYMISFYNVEKTSFFALAWGQFTSFLTYLFLTYLVINIVRTVTDVQKIFLAQAVSCFLVCAMAVYEMANPGTAIIPGWIDFTNTSSSVFGGIRLGSTFLDYELFGEYCAINLFLLMFMFARANSRSRQVALAALMGLVFFCLFATVTRGAILAFGAGLIYLTWLSRTRLNFVKLVSFSALAITLIVVGDWAVSTFTDAHSVIERLAGTHLERGVPDSRVGAWYGAIENIAEHPFIGHGPYYWLKTGLGQRFWPHNVYLYYAHIVGLVGLAFFLWLLWELWKGSRPRAPSLGSGTYIEGATLAARIMLFVFIVDQTKIDYLRNERYSFFVWFLLGLVVAVNNVARAEGRKRAVELVPLPVPDATPMQRRFATGGRPPQTSLRPAVPGP
jgi:O-antigen ligase